ncbi:MAG: glycogen-binding domain-containing protein [Gemmatimonadota bacterium]
MQTRALLLLALAGVVLPRTGEGQPRLTNDERLHDVSLDVGGLTLRRRAEPWRSAVSLVPHWRTATPDAALYLGGAVSGTQNGYESAYGTVGVELTPHKSRARPWDLAGTATVLSARETQAIGLATLRGRKHWMSERQGAWLGVTLGGRTQDQTQFGSIAAEASMWRSLAPRTTFIVSASATHAGDFLYYEYADVPVAAELATTQSPPAEFRVPHTARFGELTAALRHVDSRLEVSLDGRYRVGPSEVRGGATAFTGDVAWWLSSRYALVGLVGRQLADPTLGTATTTYASVGLRIAARSLGVQSHAAMPREPIPTRRREAVPATFEPRGLGAMPAREIELAEAEDGAYLLLNVVATTLEIAGDFSGWESLTLVRQDGRWRLPSALPPGVYRVIIRVDGADWRPPAGFPKLQDDFGGQVGVVTIR